MSKKTTIIGIVVLVLGAIAVPTGIFANDYIRNLVREGVPEAMLKIQDDATDALEDQIPGLATPDVLSGIEDEALLQLEEQLPALATPDVLSGVEDEALLQLETQLPVLATPQVLDELKDEAIAQLPAIINCSGAAIAINQSLEIAILVSGGNKPQALNDYFNDANFSTDYTFMTLVPIKGVSEYWDPFLGGGLGLLNLGYTTNAQNYLLYGNMGLPGLITDLELGLGVCGFMQLYLEASLGVPGVNATMQAGYNATWTQLQLLAGYIKDYVWDVVVKSQYSPLPIQVYAEILFHAQWTNGTLVDDGIDLSLFKSGIPPGTKGLEAGVPNPTNITLATSTNLWDDSNPLSFVNDMGIMAWLNSSYQTMIEMSFGITTTQYFMVLSWLGNFITNLTPLLIEAETGYTIPQLAQLAFYEQWANGTIQGQPILPGGFLSQLDPSFAGPPYFEVGIPTPSNFSLPLTMALWNEADPDTFVNMAGIEIWLGAAGGSIANVTYLATTFAPYGLTPSDLTTILLPWLGAFYVVRVPQLLEYDTGYTVPELAQFAFYEQWANGTINGLPVLPEGFLSQLDPSFAGAPYFEVGIPTPSNFSLLLTMALWDESIPDTFVNIAGIEIWLRAAGGSTDDIDDLASTFFPFGLTPSDLTTILLPWLGAFYTVRVPELLLYDTGHTIPELAQFALWEQWANGTINGLPILTEGFLSLRDPPIYGPPYFEVGLTEGATGLTILQCMALWNEASEYSLVTKSGVNKWYSAKPGNTVYDELKVNNGGISDSQMAKILDWLPQFRDDIVTELAIEEYNLPANAYTLADGLLYGLMIPGIALLALGGVALVISIIKRK